jgi:hypothetical protein
LGKSLPFQQKFFNINIVWRLQNMDILNMIASMRNVFIYFAMCICMPSLVLYISECVVILGHKNFRNSFYWLFLIRAIPVSFTFRNTVQILLGQRNGANLIGNLCQLPGNWQLFKSSITKNQSTVTTLSPTFGQLLKFVRNFYQFSLEKWE